MPNPTPAPIDPWAHRHSNMRCKTCMWFAPKYPEWFAPKYPEGKPAIDGEQITLPTVDLGRCRRHAPTMTGYPAVFVNDWCGDHKLNENAIQP